jgi:histone acetyltransferase (RNA polymerase elongator complex component)
MKTHAIVPIFIPHLGCPNDCVFCNQRRITSRDSAPSPADVRDVIERNLATIRAAGVPHVEIAFYGGSFTAIPADEQEAYLAVAAEYLSIGLVDGVRLSTRPDCVDDEVCRRLVRFGITLAELGVQSFDDEVLALSARGHDASCVPPAIEKLKNYGIATGIQLMVGLPGDTREKSLASARAAAALAPNVARIYPTCVIEDTALMDMMLRGEYEPPELMQTAETVKLMQRILTDAGVNVIRIGLKSGGQITDATPGFHPAFREIVEGLEARDRIETLIENLGDNITNLHIFAHPSCVSHAAGYRSANRAYFTEKYSLRSISFTADKALKRGEYRVSAPTLSANRCIRR